MVAVGVVAREVEGGTLTLTPGVAAVDVGVLAVVGVGVGVVAVDFGNALGVFGCLGASSWGLCGGTRPSYESSASMRWSSRRRFFPPSLPGVVAFLRRVSSKLTSSELGAGSFHLRRGGCCCCCCCRGCCSCWGCCCCCCCCWGCCCCGGMMTLRGGHSRILLPDLLNALLLLLLLVLLLLMGLPSTGTVVAL